MAELHLKGKIVTDAEEKTLNASSVGNHPLSQLKGTDAHKLY
jgi:hypothetical protein